MGSHDLSKSVSWLKARLRKGGPSCKPPEAQHCVEVDGSFFCSSGSYISKQNATPASFRLASLLIGNWNVLQTGRDCSSGLARNLRPTGWANPTIALTYRSVRFAKFVLLQWQKTRQTGLLQKSLHEIFHITSSCFIEGWSIKCPLKYLLLCQLKTLFIMLSIA